MSGEQRVLTLGCRVDVRVSIRYDCLTLPQWQRDVLGLVVVGVFIDDDVGCRDELASELARVWAPLGMQLLAVDV